MFYEHGFHEQQLEFLRTALDIFQDFDPCAAINFTYLIHEIMTRFATKELMQFLLSRSVLINTLNMIAKEDLNFIVRKNAAHIVSLISNYYSLDMQNLYLDEPYSETISKAFRETDFFNSFNITVIHDVLENALLHQPRIGLLSVKLVEVIDNLVRITDLELWDKIWKSNVMDRIFQLAKKFHKSDIYISYVNNMLVFILDRAISDFHPYWAVQLLANYKLQNNQLISADRQILIFEQQLSVKLIRDSDFLPYYDELKNIEKSLKTSTLWQRAKEILQIHESKHANKLGEDPELPSVEEEIIISAVEEQTFDEIIEPEENVFINCVTREKPSPFNSLKNNDPDSDDDDISWIAPGLDTLNKLKNVFRQMDLQEEVVEKASQVDKGSKKNRHLSNSLNNQTNHTQTTNFLSRSLKDDQESLSKLSLSSSTNVKKLNKSFEEFKVEIFQNRKVLRREDNSMLRVDEIDYQTKYNNFEETSKTQNY